MNLLFLAMELVAIWAVFAVIVWAALLRPEARRRQADCEQVCLHRIRHDVTITSAVPDKRPYQPATTGLDNMRRARERHGHLRP